MRTPNSRLSDWLARFRESIACRRLATLYKSQPHPFVARLLLSYRPTQGSSLGDPDPYDLSE